MEQETMCDDEYIRSGRSDDGEDDDGDDDCRDKCVDERREDWRENGITSDSASIRTRSQERVNGTCDLSQNTQDGIVDTGWYFLTLGSSARETSLLQLTARSVGKEFETKTSRRTEVRFVFESFCNVASQTQGYERNNKYVT